jgi:aldehyde dehydrogenase family 7 protein A1
MTSLVSNTSKYGFLQELGLKEENDGVFDGKSWKGTGPVVESLSPATNEVIIRDILKFVLILRVNR